MPTDEQVAHVSTPRGPLRVVGDREAVTGATFVGEAAAIPPDSAGPVGDLAGQLAEYFEGQRREFSVPLRPEGTPFQRRVWEALQAIPYGETRTYGQVAEAIGRPGAQRAVGGACRANPIVIAIPCHRVIGADGSMTGYGGKRRDLDLKRSLIAHEARQGRP